MTNQQTETEVLTPTGAALISQLAADLLNAEALSRSLRASGKAPGPKTGFPKLDREINGFLAPGIHTLLAAPGAGKTAFALQISAQAGCPALYITSEMPRLELMRRVISRTTQTFNGKLSGGNLSDSELDSLIKKAETAAPSLAFLDATENPVPPTAIIQAAQDLKAAFDSDHVLIIIDSFSDWALGLAFADPTEAKTEYQAIEAGLTSLKRVSALLAAPVLCVAHKNRASQGKGSEETLFAGKGTGRFEYVSETLWSLDPTADAGTPGFGGNDGNKTPLTLTLAKNRHGQKGAKVTFDFEGRLMEFVETGGLI